MMYSLFNNNLMNAMNKLVLGEEYLNASLLNCVLFHKNLTAHELHILFCSGSIYLD